ncbi:MAG: hypothetical protein WKF40_07710 [Thermoleophilaceae bacterium]
MPFTYATFVIGALALAGFPLLSGFFSKDEILSLHDQPRGGYVVLGVLGYLAAALTAFYAFRMVFRVFFGKAVPEAKELEGGDLYHGEHYNPATGEAEDAEVGFPGPEHHVAEKEWPMKAAMAPLAVLAVIGGVLGIPGVTDTLEHFLEPTFADSRFAETAPSTGAEISGLVVGGVAGDRRHRRRLLRVHPQAGSFAGQDAGALRRRAFLPLPQVVLRRAVRRGVRAPRRHPRALRAHRRGERRSCRASWWAAPSGMVRAGTSFARSIQTGELRTYALLLVMGVGGLVLYFLVVSS